MISTDILRKSLIYNISGERHMDLKEFCNIRNIKLLMYSNEV